MNKHSDVTLDDSSTICFAPCSTKFDLHLKHSFNPFQKLNHQNIIKGLIALSTATPDLLSFGREDYKPGEKLCPSCQKEIKNKMASDKY